MTLKFTSACGSVNADFNMWNVQEWIYQIATCKTIEKNLAVCVTCLVWGKSQPRLTAALVTGLVDVGQPSPECTHCLENMGATNTQYWLKAPAALPQTFIKRVWSKGDRNDFMLTNTLMHTLTHTQIHLYRSTHTHNHIHAFSTRNHIQTHIAILTITHTNIH